MQHTRTRGFTLIELLVVIAIIGILAGIVLASLGSARNKGSDAKVQSQLASMRGAAEIYYSTNGTYGGTVSNSCTSMFADPSSGMQSLTTGSNYPSGTVLTCNSNGSAWAAGANLSTSGKYWCVDSTGKSVSESAALASGTVVCP